MLLDIAANPSVPCYQDLLGRGLRRLADTLARTGTADNALPTYAEAAALRTELGRRFPAAPNHVWELAIVQQSMASLERELGRLPEARSRLETAITAVQHYGAGSQRFALTIMLLPGLRDELVGVLEALGDTAALERLRSERLRELPPFLPPGFPGSQQFRPRR